ncbi:MAG TPA: SDR family NAD(P)-dependent oxidoreductase [Nitrospiria bacterium]|nr:SDR family NAD(P)-dependent oxidoreductase [Nitrospiria bacterium]
MILKDKIAIVSGGGTGIGLAITEALVDAGARVMICARNFDRLSLAAKEINERQGEERVLPIKVDVKKKEEVEKSVEEVIRKWGDLHILVNNSGRSGRIPLLSGDSAAWFDILETNLNGMYFFCKAALRVMKDQAGGRIINISSILGKIGVPGYTAYCASKHGVIGFTSALALEVASRGITVNAICPGWVDTPMAELGMSETAKALGIPVEDFKKAAISRVPIHRFVSHEEVSGMAVFLAGDDGKAITGQAINIDGGVVMH